VQLLGLFVLQSFSKPEIMKKLIYLFLKSVGWEVIVPNEIPEKSVICFAPHTSNFDLVIGKLFSWSVGRQFSFLMKKSWFVFPLGYFFKVVGGIPVDRSKSNATVQQMIEEFEEHDRFHLVIAPEGTRSRVPAWRKGFYYIASGAEVPLELAFIDYEKKQIGIGKLLYPSGNLSADLYEIQQFYQNISPRYPEKYNPTNF